MIKADGYIEVTVHYDALGGVECRDYKWIGGDIARFTESLLLDADPSAVRYDRFPLEPGDRFKIGPFKLRMLESDSWCHDVIIAVRDWGLVTDLRYFWHRFGKLADIAYRRFIITLVVWRLAERHEGAIPTWRDIHVLKRLVERWRKMQWVEVKPSVVWNGWILSKKQVNDLERTIGKQDE